MTETLRLAEQLIARASVTPTDAGCQELIAQRLRALGFDCETIVSGPAEYSVTNLWAKWAADGVAIAQAAANSIANSEPPKTLVFAGHTDVVPTGPVGEWDSAPFTPSQRDGRLFGRGSSDMKVSLAAFVVAIEEFLASHPEPKLNLAMLLTSDEEGPANDGTIVVCKMLKERGETLDYCIVGEPTSAERTGDMIKNGRRGTMSGKLTIKGIQGHIAYPHLAKNPIHLAAPALAELVTVEWDKGNAFFPPTTWQISNIHAGTGASNVIPGAVVIDFNFRFSTESSPESLQTRLARVLEKYELEYDLVWTVGGLPFLTEPGALVDAVQSAILAETGLVTQLSTSGGTSDGRFIAKICPQVIEFGPPNPTIHKINEHVKLADIEPLKNIYRRTMENLERQAHT
jgi:succinyl-diaminopimelate desuccinylase